MSLINAFATIRKKKPVIDEPAAVSLADTSFQAPTPGALTKRGTLEVSWMEVV